MKPAKSARSRLSIDGKLFAYITAAATAIAASAEAQAQAITNVTVGSFTGDLNVTTPATGTASFSGTFLVGGVDFGVKIFQGSNFFSASMVGSGAAFKGSSSFAQRFSDPGAAIAGEFSNSNGRLIFLAGLSGNGRFRSADATWKTGYVAFKDGGYNGWANVGVRRVGSEVTEVTFVDKNSDGIYGAFSSGPLAVGEVGAAVPEPASAAAGLGLLALGAAGIREHRRRKQKVA